jgi:tellurite resistance protein
MFLNQLTEKEQVAFIELAHLVAVADGIMSEQEQELIQLYKQEAALSDGYQIQDLPLEEILKAFESETSKNIALLEVLAVIFSDGTYSFDERQIVKLIKQSFGFTLEKYETYKAWIRKINDVYAEGVQLIHA